MIGERARLFSRDMPGFTRTPLKKRGWWMSDTATLHFDGVRVPVGNRLGEEGRGFRVTMENFNSARLVMADEACSFAAACYDEALARARERQTFGTALVGRQVIRHKLADIRGLVILPLGLRGRASIGRNSRGML